jgi:isopentenyldiphosphate isomerase
MKEEPVDILDERGNKTGQTLLKSQAHKQGLWHPVIHLWICNSKGEALMQKRAPQKLIWPNLWDVAVGGHVAAGESPEATAVKETSEELGIKVEPQNLQFIGQSKYEHAMDAGWINRIFIWSYLIKLDIGLSELTLEKREVSDARWFELNELEKALSNPTEAKNFSPDIMQEYPIAIKEMRNK